MREKLARLIALVTAGVISFAVLIFGWQQQSGMAAMGDGIDPLLWAERYPQHYASFMRGANATVSDASDELLQNPFRQRAWAGSTFALEYNSTRAHHFAQIDQRQSRRTLEQSQPAGCINCHAAEAPQIVQDLGWDGLHAMRYDDLKADLHVGTSCADCHDSATMALVVTRPALNAALQAQGIDIRQASNQDMRSYVCAQCHVEYYFQGTGQQLVFPWANGITLENIERYYDDNNVSDWTHTETGAQMIKIQHPHFELHSNGVHGQRDIACADCHMPAIQESGMNISDHWLRSPMEQVEAACMGCHRGSAERLSSRVDAIQQNTRALMSDAETAITALMDAIVAARAAGASDTELAESRRAHRRAQLRWDFIDADRTRGFHSPDEAERILNDATEIARAALR